MKPIIGIIGRARDMNAQTNGIMVFDEYRNAVIRCGGIPMAILPTQDIDYEANKPSEMPKMTEEEIEDLKRQLDLCDGVIFPGGHRIYEYSYVAFDYLYEKDIPILGTCLGMQTMACARNGRKSWELLQKVDTQIQHRVLEAKIIHKVDIRKDSKLYDIIKKEKIEVNSKHSYCINSCGDMQISAYSEDGIIEGIESANKKFVIGVQWHPEDLINDEMETLVRKFIEAAKENSCK